MIQSKQQGDVTVTELAQIRDAMKNATRACSNDCHKIATIGRKGMSGDGC